MMQLNAQWVYKALFSLFSGVLGWLVAEFRPTLPMLSVAVLLILYDTIVAYRLSKRVYKMYPGAMNEQPKFNSASFSRVFKRTIPRRVTAILLVFIVEHWVLDHSMKATMVVTAMICGEQLLSILENFGSCRDDKEGNLWRFMRRVLVDKAERYVDVSLDEFKAMREKKREELEKGGEDHE